jgi:hypothetical protein
LDHGSIVAASERVAWTVPEVFVDRRFDATKPIVPPAWVGIDALPFVNDRERLALNHCRAFSYVHLLGNFEQFVPRHLNGIVERSWDDDRARLRALLRFSDEEIKHQELFRRAEVVLEDSCGHAFGRHFGDDGVRLADFTAAMLAYPPLPRFLIILALELGTQRHYVESARRSDEPNVDALYVDILEAHWVEEAQHVRADAIEIATLADEHGSGRARRGLRRRSAPLPGSVDHAFRGQAEQEIETLECVTGRVLPDAQRTALRDALHGSLRAILAEVGMSHPRFRSITQALSPDGAARARNLVTRVGDQRSGRLKLIAPIVGRRLR